MLPFFLFLFLHPSPSLKSFPTLGVLALGAPLSGHCFQQRYIDEEIRDVNTVFWQTGFRLLKTGFKPVFGFIGLHRNLNFKPS